MTEGVCRFEILGPLVLERDEMLRLRPTLLTLVDTATSPRVLGWRRYSLWAEAYIDGRLESALTHACASVERAEEIGHEYMLTCALEARLPPAQSVGEHITQPQPPR